VLAKATDPSVEKAYVLEDSRPAVKYRKYLARGRYYQLYSVGGEPPQFGVSNK